jgi:hypothetical protein
MFQYLLDDNPMFTLIVMCISKTKKHVLLAVQQSTAMSPIIKEIMSCKIYPRLLVHFFFFLNKKCHTKEVKPKEH